MQCLFHTDDSSSAHAGEHVGCMLRLHRPTHRASQQSILVCWPWPRAAHWICIQILHPAIWTPHYPLIDIYSQSQQEEPWIVPATSLLVAMASMTRQFVFSSAFNCAFGCGLPVCSRQDGNWTLEDEEAPVNRGTSKPGTWCFVLSSF